MNMEMAECVGAGTLVRPDGSSDLAALPWNPHPRFIGVALKHLITGADTGGALSAHLVRIAAGAELSAHTHEGSLELHEVLRGTGLCTLGDLQAAYRPGVCGLIPAGVAHSVRAATDEELYLLAKFAPALL